MKVMNTWAKYKERADKRVQFLSSFKTKEEKYNLDIYIFRLCETQMNEVFDIRTPMEAKYHFFYNVCLPNRDSFLINGEDDLLCEYLDWEDDIIHNCLNNIILKSNRLKESYISLCENQRSNVDWELNGWGEDAYKYNSFLKVDVSDLDTRILRQISQHKQEMLERGLIKLLEEIIEEGMYLQITNPKTGIRNRIYEKLYLMHDYLERNILLKRGVSFDSYIFGHILLSLQDPFQEKDGFDRLWRNYTPINVYLSLKVMILQDYMYISKEDTFNMKWNIMKQDDLFVYIFHQMLCLHHNNNVFSSERTDLHILAWFGIDDQKAKTRESFVFGINRDGEPFLQNESGAKAKLNIPQNIYDSTRVFTWQWESIIEYLSKKLPSLVKEISFSSQDSSK